MKSSSADSSSSAERKKQRALASKSKVTVRLRESRHIKLPEDTTELIAKRTANKVLKEKASMWKIYLLDKPMVYIRKVVQTNNRLLDQVEYTFNFSYANKQSHM